MHEDNDNESIPSKKEKIPGANKLGSNRGHKRKIEQQPITHFSPEKDVLSSKKAPPTATFPFTATRAVSRTYNSHNRHQLPREPFTAARIDQQELDDLEEGIRRSMMDKYMNDI